MEYVKRERKSGGISDIPGLWLVKSRVEVDAMGENRKPLEMYYLDAEERRRRFVIAELNDGRARKVVMRLGSYLFDNQSHRDISDNLKADVDAIDPKSEIRILGGGFIYADYENKTVYFESRSSGVGAADLNAVIDLLKKELPKSSEEYIGFRIVGRMGANPLKGTKEGPEVVAYID